MAKQTAIQAKSVNDGFVPDDDGFEEDEEGFVEDMPEQSTGDWLLKNVAKPAIATPLDMITGATQGGVDLANLIPGVHMQPPLDLAQAAGVGGNRGDELIKNLSSYIPTAAGSEAALPLASMEGIGPIMAKLAAEGGIYQTSQTPDSPGKIALAAGVNAGIPGLFHGIGEGLSKGLEYFGAPGVANNIVSPIMDLKDLKNSQAFSDASDNFTAHQDLEDSAWKSVTKDSEANSDKKLDTSKYVNPILGKIKEYEDLSYKHSPFKDDYEAAIKNLKGYLNKDDVEGLVPKDELDSYGHEHYSNYPDALRQNVALNKAYKNTVRPNTGIIKSKTELEATNFARDALQNMIGSNMDNHGLSDTLGIDWQNARNLTRDSANIFQTVPDAKGNPKISDFYAHTLSNNPYNDPTTFVNQYIPKKGEGTGPMEQFSAMVGNKDKATDYLKSNIFNDAMTGQKPNISKFVDIANDLSPDQLGYLFNPNQQEQLKLLSKLNEKYPTQMPDAWKSIATGAAAGLLGIAAHPLAPVIGASGPTAYHLAYRAASIPSASNRIQNAMIARMQGQGPIMGQTLPNVSRSLIAANQSGGTH